MYVGLILEFGKFLCRTRTGIRSKGQRTIIAGGVAGKAKRHQIMARTKKKDKSGVQLNIPFVGLPTICTNIHINQTEKYEYHHIFLLPSIATS
jgi:hypothetical protein